MSEPIHPQVAALAGAYARDLARCIPGRRLDARIERLVAAPPKYFSARPAPAAPRAPASH